MTAGPRPTNVEIAGLVAGFALWSLAFLLLYGGHGALCAVGAGGARALLLSIWAGILLAHIGLILWFAKRWRVSPDELRFVRMASLILAIAAMAATVWTGLPIATLTLC